MARWHTRVDPELNQWFEEHYPMHGSKQWFIETSLRSLRRLVEEGKVEPPLHAVELATREGADV